MEAVRALDLLQDQLDWADVKSSWKSAAARWAKQLRKCRYPADLDLLWKLAGELMKSIKPTNFIGGWLVNADGSKLTRYRQWLTRTDASCACAILKAVRVLRAHLVRVVDGPLYALDGTPLPDAAHASAAPAPLATEPIEPPREKSAAGLAAAASDDEFLLLNTRRETPNRMRSQTLIPPAVEPRVAEGERSTVLPNHAVTLADRWLVQEMSSERLAEEAQKGVPEVEEHSSASAPCYERSMRKTPAAIDYAAVLATVEDDSAAAAQPWCIGGSVPGESAPTEVQLALIASDEDASDEAVALAEEVSQVSVDGDAHLATTEGLAAGAVYGSQVEVRWRWTPTVWHSVAESAGMQTATQAQQAAVMMQYYGPAHTFSHTPPISLMAPHSFQPFGAPAHHVLQHPAFGGSVPGESAPTEVQLALIASDEDASDEAVALAEEVSQVSVDGDAHLATTEGLAAGAVYGSQVEVDANGVAESADNGLYTPRLRKACDLCHENRLKCTMLPTGSCEQCTVRGIECKRRMERKRGRPRITAENIVQLVQRRTAARKQLPGGASGRVRNAAARAIGAVPQSGAFPSFHDPAIQAAYAAGMQTATQAQQAAVMMQYYGPAHTFSHTPPISLMAPHSFQPFGAPAHHVLQHPAFGGSTQPLFNGEAMAAMAGQYGVGGMDGSAAYELAAMYAHFQQQQQQQLSPPPGYSSYAHQSAHNPSTVAAAAAAAAAAAHTAAPAPAPGAALLAPDTPPVFEE